MLALLRLRSYVYIHIPPRLTIYLFRRPNNASPNDAGERLAPNTVQQSNGKGDGANKDNREAGEEPKGDADILFLAHVSTPLDCLDSHVGFRRAGLHDGWHAGAYEASLGFCRG